jgi:hypothetical protein
MLAIRKINCSLSCDCLCEAPRHLVHRESPRARILKRCSSPQSKLCLIHFACAGEEVSVSGLLEVRSQVVEGLRDKPGDKYLETALKELDEAIVALGGELPE